MSAAAAGVDQVDQEHVDVQELPALKPGDTVKIFESPGGFPAPRFLLGVATLLAFRNRITGRAPLQVWKLSMSWRDGRSSEVLHHVVHPGDLVDRKAG